MGSNTGPPSKVRHHFVPRWGRFGPSVVNSSTSSVTPLRFHLFQTFCLMVSPLMTRLLRSRQDPGWVLTMKKNSRLYTRVLIRIHTLLTQGRFWVSWSVILRKKHDFIRFTWLDREWNLLVTESRVLVTWGNFFSVKGLRSFESKRSETSYTQSSVEGPKIGCQRVVWVSKIQLY